MRKTFRVDFNHIGDLAGGPDFESWMSDWGKNFADQTADITVETVEKEKLKVQICESFTDTSCSCRKSARWKIDGSDIGRPFYSCDEHVHRALSYAARTYTISPISPQPPELPKPVVVEWEDDLRLGYHAVIRVPEELRNKCFTVRF